MVLSGGIASACVYHQSFLWVSFSLKSQPTITSIFFLFIDNYMWGLFKPNMPTNLPNSTNYSLHLSNYGFTTLHNRFAICIYILVYYFT
jgi:hypothetical protein